MSKRLALIVVLLSVLAGVTSTRIGHANNADGLIVHEWGTFTSVAGVDGSAVQWSPQVGPTDLPGFVDRVSCHVKVGLVGKVHMETPVIYFYAPREITVNVRVRFPQGVITEWFPRPSRVSQDTINAAFRGDFSWTDVKVEPAASGVFPVEPEKNHYYVARETDAAPLQIGPDQERFLFYRGVGRLPPPINARVAEDGQIVVAHTRGNALGDIMLFENRDGVIAYTAQRGTGAAARFTPLEPEGEAPSPQMHLQERLVAHGLYPREAKAMVESWRETWFEQGTRLFYIVSGDEVDEILPLQIDPQPVDVKRVFVGRMEIATPATLREVKSAIEKGDRAKLAEYGRFLEPIGGHLLSSLPAIERPAMVRRLEDEKTKLIAQWAATSTTCPAVVPLR